MASKAQTNNQPNLLLRTARKERRWSQADLAEQVGVNTLEIGRWERGEAFPQQSFQRKLIEIFKKSAQDLGLVKYQEEDDPASNDNLFSFNESLRTPQDFYGREREKKLLLDRTKRRAPTSIVGPGRIGKTWLVRYLSLNTEQFLGPQVRMGYIDASSPICHTRQGFIEEVQQQLRLTTEMGGMELANLQRTLQQAKELKPVLCLDKFEYFTRNQKQFTPEFFQGLRSMAQTSLLTLVVVTKEPLYTLFSPMTTPAEEIELTSFFPNIFEQITLKPFRYEEALQFIESKSQRTGLTKDECDYFWRYGKVGKVEEKLWSPILLQGIGRILLELEYQQIRNTSVFRQLFEQRFAEICRVLGIV